jgi:alpha/beta superfamily hydrolase
VSNGAARAVSTEALAIQGPAGVLEGALERGAGPPAAVAVVCHPHPLHQGTMNHKVVTTLARAFVRLGAAALRFNFRGVGASAGSYADGVGEREDALAAVAWARAEWPGKPLYLAGFSFGAAVALAVAARVAPRGLVTVAPPIDRLPIDLRLPECPWLLIHGRADEVVPVEPVVAWCAALARPPRLVVPEGVGHFFHGQLGLLTTAVVDSFGADFERAEAPA